MDIMHMSSDILQSAARPDYDPSVGYLTIYIILAESIHLSMLLIYQQWLPNTVGRYQNCDPVLINYLNRLGIESTGKNCYTFPQKGCSIKLEFVPW
jgi:hypothetical protein